MDYRVAALLALPFIGAMLVVLAARASRTAAALTAGGIMLAGVALLLSGLPTLMAGDVIRFNVPWLPEYGLDFRLWIDGLGMLFVLLICGIGALIVLYANYYLPSGDRMGRFYAILLLFAGGMLGVVLADNLILMVIFWEITGLTSFLLIAYKYYNVDSRIAARMALAVTGGGGLCLLAGVILLGQIAGTYTISEVISRGDVIKEHALYPVMLGLVLLGCFTKSGQFPFHFWLPNAMAAPTPVSAYLHSATMVKAGIFLLARLYPALGGTEMWMLTVSTAGMLTFAYGAYLAMIKYDFKGLLAYSTLSHLGLVTVLFGLSTPMAMVAGLFHIINHAVFKASLFMTAGIVDHETGTRDMRRLSGLHKLMPITATLAVIASGAMAGVPLFNGFLSKEMFFMEAVEQTVFGGIGRWLFPVFATIAGIWSFAYSARFVHDIFFNGEPGDLPQTPHEPPRWMRIPIELLVALVLAIGIFPQLVVGDFLKVVAGSVLGADLPTIKLTLWHGFNIPLLMSVVAILGGLAWYWQRERVFAAHARFFPKIDSPVAFERFWSGVVTFAGAVTDWLDNKSLQRNAALYVAALIAVAGWAWWGGPDTALTGPNAMLAIDPVVAGGLMVLVVGTIGTVLFHRQRLIAIVMMSVVGLVVSLTFVRFGGPDLALTQLSVEVVTVILLLLALRYMPQEGKAESDAGRRLRDIGLSVLVGVGITALIYAMLTRPFDTISGYMLANSVPKGGGSNVVNVILVDFRGFDTFGEIAVLAMAALGLQALLDRQSLTPRVPLNPVGEDRFPVMLAQLMRPLLPLALLVSVYIFLRGHGLPGGGFIAGLIAAVAIVLQYLANGIGFADERIRADFTRVLGFGLAAAAITGLASWVFGYPFLTSTFSYFYPPVIGKFELASAMAFDVGVYLVVIGSIVIGIVGIGRLSLGETKAPVPKRPSPTPANAAQPTQPEVPAWS